ncbi:MAG: AI-2E family transporter [Actinobacteria bacterium]|nr:AI-2E family transporter [Actinomycetota bacterium]
MPRWNRGEGCRRVFIILLAGLFLYSAFIVRGIMVSFLLAGVLVYLFNPLVDRLESRGCGRTSAILLVYAAAAIIVAGVSLYGIPRGVGQLDRLVVAIPAYTGQVQEISRSIEAKYSRAGLPVEMKEIIDERINWVEARALSLVNRAISGMVSLLGHLFSILLAPVLAFYLLRDFNRFKEDFYTVVPHRWQNDVVILAGDINLVLDRYIRGYLLVCLIVGVLTGTAMFLLGVEFAFILGVFAGLTEIIPYFGPFIGSLPAVLLALLTSKWLALKVVIAFLVIQQLEGSVISPKILGDRVGLHPLAVILALLVAGELFGLPGMLLAVPSAAIIKILLVFTWKKLKAY